MKTFLLIFWLGGAVAFVVSGLLVVNEGASRFKKLYPNAKVIKASRATSANTLIQIAVLSLIPFFNWWLAGCFTFQFEKAIAMALDKVVQGVDYALQTDDGTNSENRS